MWVQYGISEEDFDLSPKPHEQTTPTPTQTQTQTHAQSQPRRTSSDNRDHSQGEGRPRRRSSSSETGSHSKKKRHNSKTRKSKRESSDSAGFTVDEKASMAGDANVEETNSKDEANNETRRHRQSTEPFLAHTTPSNNVSTTTNTNTTNLNTVISHSKAQPNTNPVLIEMSPPAQYAHPEPHHGNNAVSVVRRDPLPHGRISPTTLALVFVLVIVVCLIAILSPLYASKISSLAKSIKSLGAGGVFAFIAIEIVWMVLCLPPAPLSVAAGYVFGFGLGFIVVVVGHTIGSFIAFSVARAWLGGLVHRHLTSRSVWLLAVHELARTSPYRTTLLLRFSSAPASLKNYGLSAVSTVPHRVFLLCTILSSAVLALATCWVGSSADDLVKTIKGSESTPPQIAAIVFGSVLVVILVVVTYKSTKTLQARVSRMSEPNPSL